MRPDHAATAGSSPPDCRRRLTSANKLVLSLDSGYGDNTKFNRDLERLLVQANDAVRSIRALADLLARHPEALIKGRAGGAARMIASRGRRWLGAVGPGSGARRLLVAQPGALHDRAGSAPSTPADPR